MLILVFVVLNISNLFSQIEDKALSFQFNNTHIEGVICQIENKTNYSFFYVDEWIEGKTITFFTSSYRQSTYSSHIHESSLT